MKKTIKPSLLFSYGTLRDSSVQIALFKRRLKGTPDTLKSYRLDQITLSDQDGVEYHYPAAVYTGNLNDQIPGLVFQLSTSELFVADSYETEAYHRQLVGLVSGKKAWVYLYQS